MDLIGSTRETREEKSSFQFWSRSVGHIMSDSFFTPEEVPRLFWPFWPMTEGPNGERIVHYQGKSDLGDLVDHYVEVNKVGDIGMLVVMPKSRRTIQAPPQGGGRTN